MVDKIAIGWPFYPAISRQAAIHRIAKPLDYIANEHHSKPSGRQAACSIADKNCQGAHHPGRSENVWCHPGVHMRAQPCQKPPLRRGENIFLDTSERLLSEVRLLRHVPLSGKQARRSEEHTSELQSLMRNSYDVFSV